MKKLKKMTEKNLRPSESPSFRKKSLERMKSSVSIAKPKFLNPDYRLNPDSVQLPEGLSDYMIGLVRKGLFKIRKVSDDSNARLAVLLSGGVDSAVALQLAYNAVGPKNVVAITTDHSTLREQEKQDCQKRDSLISKLGVEEAKQDITRLIEEELNLLLASDENRRLFESKPELFEACKSEAIARARIVAMLNYCGFESLHPIDTGNLTEAVLGQYTVGDSSGFSVNVLSPLLKGEIRKLGKEIGLDSEYYLQEKRTSEFDLAGGEQLGATDEYLDPIVHLYLTGNNFSVIARKTGHDSKWIKKLGKRIQSKSRLVRASVEPIVDVEQESIVPSFRDLWKVKTENKDSLCSQLQETRNKYMPN